MRTPIALLSSFAVLSAVLLAPLVAQAQGASTVKTYPPKSKSSAGVDLALGDAIGVAGWYDTIFVQGKPGHGTFGAMAVLVFDDDGDRNCDDDEAIFGAAGRMKYVLDVHPRMRPWAGVGLGVYAVSRDDDRCTNEDDDEMGIGIPISVGFDYALDTLTLGLSANFHQTTADEDFAYLALGVAWRF